MLHANPPENAADEFVSYSAMYKRKIQQTKELRYRVNQIAAILNMKYANQIAANTQYNSSISMSKYTTQ